MKFPYDRVVMVSPARLGDTITCTPAIRLLKRFRPKVEIDMICLTEVSASVLLHNPCIDELYVLPGRRTIKGRIGYYDIGINIHRSDKATKYFRWLKVDVIDKLPIGNDKHSAQQRLEVIQSLLKCEITEEDRSYALYPQSHHFAKIKDLLLSEGVSLNDEILVGCHLGCHGIAKRGKRFWKPFSHRKVWPLENFVELEDAARKIDPRVRFILTGSKNEKPLGRTFQRQSSRVVNLIGKTSVLDLTALMSYLKGYITSDTGALHVACATDVNLVALFLPRYLQRYAPYPLRANHTVICKPNMEEIRVQNVLDTIKIWCKDAT